MRDQDYGVWTGRTLPELEAEQPGVLQAWASDPLFAPPGGESIKDLCNRATAFLSDMAMMPGTTVAVTHGPLVRAAILCVLDAPVLSFWRIDTPPLSCTEFSFDGRRWALRLGVTT
ncbi:putative phosphoglycerate mutase (fragment) [Mesorhizobium metallidurans STM 2683]|uniref:Putative phosphoglycerate mutase n=1 Tax=Mesorhizobium metallidurans STM 2683 TaxID=1297569 RepID=M5EW57_9HYPH